MPAPPSAPLLLSVFATFAVGGPQVRFANVANRLGGAWRHAVVAMDGNLACRDRLHPGLDVAFPPMRIGGRPDRLLREMRRVLRAVRPHTLLTHNWGSIEWAVANRLPFPLARHVHAEDGFGPEERSSQLRRRVWARRLALRGLDLALPSQTLLAVARDVWRLSPARLHYLPNGVDLSRFGTARGGVRPAAWNLRPGGIVVGTVAALRPEKNLRRLIHAFAALPPGSARLVVVGDGPSRASLEAEAAALGPGEVCFIGHMPDPAAAYPHFDVFALTSDTEQMPLSVLEAMASGLPVAATAVGDVPAMLAPPNRDHLAPRDDLAFAATLRRLVEDAPLRGQLGAANRARAEAEFDEGTMVGRWRALLAGTAAGRA